MANLVPRTGQEVRVRGVGEEAVEYIVPAHIPPARVITNRGPDEVRVIGTARNNEYIMSAYPHHVYGPVIGGEDDPRQVEFRIGAGLYSHAIEDAWDFFSHGMKFALPRATVGPCHDLEYQRIEVIWIAAIMACYGQKGNITFGPNEEIWMTAGQAFVVGLPDEMLYTTVEANAVMFRGAKMTLAAYTENLRASLRTMVGDLAWIAPGHEEELPVEHIGDIIRCSAVAMTDAGRTTMMSVYVGIFLAYTQQGNITQRKLTKITQELQASQVLITLTSVDVALLWTRFGSFFDEDCAATFFPRWENIFTGRILRMRLIFQQAANVGLLGLTTIRAMLTTCPRFPWHELIHMYPDAWARFKAADELVGENTWAGFRKDMSVLGVNNYLPFAYAAIELKKHVMGDGEIGAASTARGAFPDKMKVERMVTDYRNRAAAITPVDAPKDELLTYYHNRGVEVNEETLCDGGPVAPVAPGVGPAFLQQLQQLMNIVGPGAPGGVGGGGAEGGV